MTTPVQSASTRFDNAASVLIDALAAAVAERLSTPTRTAGPEADWRLLNVEEAASRLGRSSRWIRERVKRGDLPFVKLDGGALAFELVDLQNFATRRRVPEPESLATRLQAVRKPASTQGSRGTDRVDHRRVA